MSTELPPALEAAITQIRAALQAGADVEAKRTAALACRVLLNVLEAQPGQPLQVPTGSASAPAGAPTASASPGAPASPAAPASPIDVFLSRFAAKFGADVAPDPSVPYVRLGQAAAVFEQLIGLGSVR
jgi:hypothetical protein